jgi:hypothetical protein
MEDDEAAAAAAAGASDEVETANEEAGSAEAAADRSRIDAAAGSADGVETSKEQAAAQEDLDQKEQAVDEASKTVIKTFFEQMMGKEMTGKQLEELQAMNDKLMDIVRDSITEPGNPSDPSRPSSQAAAKVCLDYNNSLSPEMQAANDAQVQACQARVDKVLDEIPGLDAKKYKALRDGLGKMSDNFDLETGKVKEGSPYDKASKPGPKGEDSPIEQAQAEIAEAIQNDPKMKKAAEEAAAKDGTRTWKEVLDGVTKVMGILAVLGSIGFAVWFAFQFSHDNTGCFSYVGSLGANKMNTCNAPAKVDNKTWASIKCNCAGAFTAGAVSENPIKCSPTNACKGGDAPPNTCSLGGPQAKIAGGSYAACTQEVATPKSVLYAYKEQSPLQSLAALPKWLGDFGKGFLPDMNSLKGVLKMILYAGLGILGAIILLMIIRFSWNYFKTHRDIGKKREGSGNKSSGMRTRSRR